MTLDAIHLGLALGGLIAGFVVDCNRRVRELQRRSDQNAEWLHTLIARRKLERRTDAEPPRHPARKRS